MNFIQADSLLAPGGQMVRNLPKILGVADDGFSVALNIPIEIESIRSIQRETTAIPMILS
jgi:hypothetical protein